MQAPSPIKTIGTGMVNVGPDEPTTVLNVSAKLGIVRKLISSEGAG